MSPRENPVVREICAFERDREPATASARSQNGWKPCLTALGILIVLAAGCSARRPDSSAATPDHSDQPSQPDFQVPAPDASAEEHPTTQPAGTPVADVISVQVSGDPEAYRFAVGISSPDEGCELYADWWEVLAEDGRLLYRRILTHSHVDEQPFVRSGGPVEIGNDTVVWVRAHMHGGYGGQAMKGTARSGFEAFDLEPGFAPGAEGVAPLPAGCAF